MSEIAVVQRSLSTQNRRACVNLSPFTPAITQRTGDKAVVRFSEFFVAAIENRNTRNAYYHACYRFLLWCDLQEIMCISEVSAIHIAAYLHTLADYFEKTTIRQHLAAIRSLFNWLVLGHVLEANQAALVRGPKYDLTRGLTPVLAAPEVRKFIDSIETDTSVGLRDRALVGLMLFSFARVSAALTMRIGDYFVASGRRWVRLKEKGGRIHEMPVHPTLESYVASYLDTLGTSNEPSMPLFRARASLSELKAQPMDRSETYRMIQERVEASGIGGNICCHTFRATGITIYLSNGGTLENAQVMAGHRRLQTTKLYDRRNDSITRAEVERIRI